MMNLRDNLPYERIACRKLATPNKDTNGDKEK